MEREAYEYILLLWVLRQRQDTGKPTIFGVRDVNWASSLDKTQRLRGLNRRIGTVGNMRAKRAPICNGPSWPRQALTAHCATRTPGCGNTSSPARSPHLLFKSRNLDLNLFKCSAIDLCWSEVFPTVPHVLMVWHFAIKMNWNWLRLEYDLDTLHSILPSSFSMPCWCPR